MSDGRTLIVHASAEDAHADAVAHALRQRGWRVVILVDEECFETWSIEDGPDGIFFELFGERIGLHKVSAVYWRTDYRCRPADLVASNPSWGEVAEFIAEQRERHAYGLWYSVARHVPFINAIEAGRRAQSKAYQQKLASEIQLRVPKTYSGSCPASAKVFAQGLWAEGKRCCTKNIEGTRFPIGGVQHARYTRLFDSEELSHIEGLSACPMIFQEYIEKQHEYRVTVVGRRVFACRIDSQCSGGDVAVDWRHYDIPNTPHHECSLSAVDERRLVDLVQGLGLVYGACDLIRATNGELVFLEVNSFGAWLWIEDLVGLKITSAIADALEAL